MSRIGVVAALDCERRTLTRARSSLGEIHETTEGFLIGVSGPGAHGAMALSERLLEHRVDRLLSWGLAGALVPQLQPGDLLMPRYLVGFDGRRHAVHANWWQDCSESLGRVGEQRPLAESSMVVVNKAQKRALHTATGAVAVDMESVAVARVADAAGIPFLCVRAIADSLEHNVPAWILDHFDRQGCMKTGAVVRRGICSPGDWSALLGLSLASAKALRCLQRVAPYVFGRPPTKLDWPPNR